jgi:hypothetical protein
VTGRLRAHGGFDVSSQTKAFESQPPVALTGYCKSKGEISTTDLFIP